MKWATGDLQEKCQFLLNTQLTFFKKEEDPTSMQFDDDERIRLLAEAQDVTTDIPEDSVTYGQQAADHPKSSARSDGRVLAEMFRGDLWRSVREKLQP